MVMNSMTDAELKRYEKQLETLIQTLNSMDLSAQENRAIVTLDQSSIGRLSRMDAMQQQAMANATSQRRKTQIASAKAAIKRITEGEYGFCMECGDKIAIKRLDHNPAVVTCISCASG